MEGKKKEQLAIYKLMSLRNIMCTVLLVRSNQQNQKINRETNWQSRVGVRAIMSMTKYTCLITYLSIMYLSFFIYWKQFDISSYVMKILGFQIKELTFTLGLSRIRSYLQMENYCWDLKFRRIKYTTREFSTHRPVITKIS